MNINFIITCHDKEDYLYGLREVLSSYKLIKPSHAIAYNGNIEYFPCDIRIPNSGHQIGDIELTMAGYRLLSSNGSPRFIKTCIDSWLLDEKYLIDIFNTMEKSSCSYAGNQWFPDNPCSLSTDIFFSDIRFGNIFKNFQWDGSFYETSMYKTLLAMKSNIAIINEREPVVPNNRFFAEKLNWTMSHDLKDNLNNLWQYNKIKKINCV